MQIMRPALALIALLATYSVSNAASVAETIKDCWDGNDHRGMSLCVGKRAVAARAALYTAEESMRRAIASSAAPSGYIRPIRQSFEASVAFHRRYKSKQCKLREDLAAVGNGSAEIRMACEAELDVNRAEQLTDAESWLQ